jgi:hypothetical protein
MFTASIWYFVMAWLYARSINSPYGYTGEYWWLASDPKWWYRSQRSVQRSDFRIKRFFLFLSLYDDLEISYSLCSDGIGPGWCLVYIDCEPSFIEMVSHCMVCWWVLPVLVTWATSWSCSWRCYRSLQIISVGWVSWRNSTTSRLPFNQYLHWWYRHHPGLINVVNCL